MSAAEVVLEFLLRIVYFGLSLAVLLWIFPLLMRQMSKHVGGRWGQPDGSLFMLDPRRLWCRHPVSWYGQGTHGLWAVWCDLCGRKVGGR